MFKDKKRAALIPAVLMALLAAVILGSISMLTYDKPSSEPTNTFGNLMNGGYAAIDRTLTYYVDSDGVLHCDGQNSSYKVADSSCDLLHPYKSGVVYRQNGAVKYSTFTGSETVTLVENAGSFMLSGDWIYYTDAQNSLKKVRFGSSHVRDLGLTVHGQFAVSGTSVFYTDEQGYLCTAKTDGSGAEIFYNEKTDCFMMNQAYIYYISGGKLCSVLTSNSASKTTIADADEFCIMSGVLIYVRGGQMYTLDLSEAEPQESAVEFQGTNPHSLCVANSFVYYRNDEGQAIRMRKDGSEWTVL
jgi:hypothetical protein